jgi:hypothetical protein
MDSWRRNMRSKKVWAVLILVLAASFFVLVPTSNGQTGQSSAMRGRQNARVSVPVDWSTDYVVAPMLDLGGVRILASRDPRVLHRRLLAQRRANGRIVSPIASGGLYFERVGADTADTADQVTNFDVAAGRTEFRALRPRPRRFQRRTFVTDWSFPATGGLGGSVVGSPAKFNFDVTATPDCTNDILYVPVNVVGSANRANLIALRNLYTNPSGTGACSGTGPTIVWTLGFTGTMQTSPVLSLDGSLLFVVESRTAGAIVHAIPTGSVNCGTGCTLTVPGTVTDLWSATLSGSANNTNSSPFIEYTFTTPNQDELFVGDNAGIVHRFTNINTASGAEVTTGGWPVTISGAGQLSSPTVDFNTGYAFVGDANGVLHRITISSGAVTSSAAVGGSSPYGGIVDAPVIDVVNQRVLVATGNYLSGFAARLAEFAEAFSSGASPTTQKILGPGAIANMHRPAFDNAFLSTGSGFAYVGGLSIDGSDTVMLRFPYTDAGGLGAGSASVSLTNSGTPAGGETSPVTVFRNANTGYEFAYISGLAAAEQFVNRINTADFTTVVNFDPQLGGTSPIVVDNIGAASEQSNIYFGTRAGAASRVIKLLQQF